MNILLLVDLEGVVGVDQVGDLLEGQPGFPRAQALLTAEITAACDGLRRGQAAASGVVISDSHHGGSGPTVDPALLAGLGPGVRVHRADDDYGPALLSEVQAVACLGMHAGARGFAPHTLDLSCVWEVDGRPLSEADLLLGVAAARGLPAVFLSGDDALDPRGLPFVPTKTALSPVSARSRPMPEVLAEIRQAASGRPVPAPALPGSVAPDGSLAVRFRSRWMAERAERAGHRRLDETAVALDGPDLEARIRRGRALVAGAAAPLGQAFRPWALDEDAAALARRTFARSLPGSRQEEARRALHALLARTEISGSGADAGGAGAAASADWARALRALTLHMLEAHAPAFFAAQQLAPVLARAQADLAQVPAGFPLSLDPPEAMARLDALYVLHERGVDPGRGGRGFDVAALGRYITACRDREPLHGWLLGQLAGQIGIPVPGPELTRPFRRSHRVRDLFWVTHQYLLATRYLRHPLPPPSASWEAPTEELLLATRALLEHGFLDLAAEVAFCLVAAGEDRAPERAQILAALAAHQRPDGSVVQPADPSTDPRQRFRDETHCTAAALLALATATG